MLAEYFAPLPTSIDCTVAVWTGSGGCLGGGSVVCTQLRCQQSCRGDVRSESLRAVGIHRLHSSPRDFSKCRLCIPEGKQALFVIVLGIGDRGLLLEHVAHQHR